MFLPFRGSGGMLPQKILKIMCLRLDKVAFHCIFAVKIKCHLTILLKHLINLAFLMECVRIFSMHLSVGMYQIACVSRRQSENNEMQSNSFLLVELSKYILSLAQPLVNNLRNKCSIEQTH